MYTSTLEAELLVIDEFDTWSIGDLIAYMSPCIAPDPKLPEDPESADA